MSRSPGAPAFTMEEAALFLTSVLGTESVPLCLASFTCRCIFFASILLHSFSFLNKRKETRVPKHSLCVQKGLSCGGEEQQDGIRSLQAQRNSTKPRCCLYTQALPPSASASPSEPVTWRDQLVATGLC